MHGTHIHLLHHKEFSLGILSAGPKLYALKPVCMYQTSQSPSIIFNQQRQLQFMAFQYISYTIGNVYMYVIGMIDTYCVIGKLLYGYIHYWNWS